jgi:hypothetical protein
MILCIQVKIEYILHNFENKIPVTDANLRIFSLNLRIFSLNLRLQQLEPSASTLPKPATLPTSAPGPRTSTDVLALRAQTSQPRCAR